MKKGLWLILLLLLCLPLFSQASFKIENEKGRFKQKFELVNNLVVVPVEVNGVELSFLLDTGIGSTLIFSLDKSDSLEIKNASSIQLRGLGAGTSIAGFKSLENTVRLGDAVDKNHTIYIITEDIMGLSGRLGVPINGILGYDFFKDVVVELNYSREFLKVYDPLVYKYKRCKRCIDLPLGFHRDKPYLRLEATVPSGEEIEVNLLVDSGSGDALWLFPDAQKGIEVPEKSFEDFLGFGISGSVYGRRSRIKNLSFGKYDLPEITTSFPDSLYIQEVKSYEERDGSLGAQVLKRFHSVIDYRNKRIRLQPNRFFKDPFEYNMSGIVVEHHGYQVYKDLKYGQNPMFNMESEPGKGIPVYKDTYEVKFSLEPAYRIAEVRPSSPAEKAGLKQGDILVSLNKKPAHKFTLDKINRLFSSKEGKKIKLVVDREGNELEFEFELEKIL